MIYNNHYLGNVKSFNSFRNTIDNIVEIYSGSKRKYNSKEFSVTQAIVYYIKNNNIKLLMTYKDLLNICKEFIKYKKIKKDLEDIEDYETNIITKELKNKSQINDYSDKESSDSSVDEDEKIEFTYNKFDNNNNGGNNDDNQEPDEGNNNKIPSKKLINNKNRKKSIKNIKYKSS